MILKLKRFYQIQKNISKLFTHKPIDIIPWEFGGMELEPQHHIDKDKLYEIIHDFINKFRHIFVEAISHQPYTLKLYKVEAQQNTQQLMKNTEH